MKWRLNNKDGKTVPVELKVTSLLNADGKTIGRIGVARDIRERKQAEKALRESETSLKAVFRRFSRGDWFGRKP